MMGLSALAEAVQAFARSLRIPTIFPAGLFVIFNLYFILPVLPLNVDTSAAGAISLVVALTLILSYLLFVSTFRLNEIFQGLALRNVGYWQRRLQGKHAELDELLEETGTLQTQLNDFKNYLELRKDEPVENADPELRATVEPDISHLIADLRERQNRLEFDYPAGRDQLLPTTVGNIMQAFRSYAWSRYGMEWDAIWPRFTPLLKEKGYYDYISLYEDAFDFLKNTYTVVVLLGIELFYVNLYLGEWEFAILDPILAALLCILLYQGMIVAARQWGVTVRAAFDLYRHELGQALGLLPGHPSLRERDLWQQASDFFSDRRKSDALERVFIASQKSRQHLVKTEQT